MSYQIRLSYFHNKSFQYDMGFIFQAAYSGLKISIPFCVLALNYSQSELFICTLTLNDLMMILYKYIHWNLLKVSSLIHIKKVVNVNNLCFVIIFAHRKANMHLNSQYLYLFCELNCHQMNTRNRYSLRKPCNVLLLSLHSGCLLRTTNKLASI
jgi:hypothetical protein